jgi:hypothetical protein
VYCIMAGYRASPRQWKKFDDEWRATLKNAVVREFHANVFFNRRINRDPQENPYLRWTDDKAATFLGTLLDTIAKRQLHPIGCAVDVPAFHALDYGQRCALTGQLKTKGRRQPSPYLFVFTSMVSMAVQGIHPDVEIHFRLGLHPGYKGRAVDIFADFHKWDFGGKAHQLAGIGFYSASNEPGLQAADLYAHSWYNTLTRKGRLNEENVRVMNALTRKRRDILVADAARLQRIVERVQLTPEEQEYLRTLKPSQAERGTGS